MLTRNSPLAGPRKTKVADRSTLAPKDIVEQRLQLPPSQRLHEYSGQAIRVAPWRQSEVDDLGGGLRERERSQFLRGDATKNGITHFTQPAGKATPRRIQAGDRIVRIDGVEVVTVCRNGFRWPNGGSDFAQSLCEKLDSAAKSTVAGHGRGAKWYSIGHRKPGVVSGRRQMGYVSRIQGLFRNRRPDATVRFREFTLWENDFPMPILHIRDTFVRRTRC